MTSAAPGALTGGGQPVGRQALAEFYGATDIVEERGEEGAEPIKSLTNGLGAHSAIDAVGTQESTMQAIGATRPNGHMALWASTMR